MYESARGSEVGAMLGIESTKADADVRPGLEKRSRPEGHVVVMDRRMQQSAPSAHLVLPEKSHSQAKASLRNPEARDIKAVIGSAIQRAVSMAGMSNKEAAAKIGVNDSQFGKWLSGLETPQVHRVFAVEELQQPFVVALARMIEACEQETTIRFIQRRA